jgi:hypothetical protein
VTDDGVAFDKIVAEEELTLLWAIPIFWGDFVNYFKGRAVVQF